MDATKYAPIGGGGGGGNLVTDLKSLFQVLKTRRTVAFAYAFTLIFVSFTVFLAFSPSPNASSPWFTNIFSSSATTTTTADSYKSQIASIFSYFFHNTTTTTSSSPIPFYPHDSSFNSTSRSSNTSTETTLKGDTFSRNSTQSSQNSVPVSVPSTNKTTSSSSTTNSVPVSVPSTNKTTSANSAPVSASSTNKTASSNTTTNSQAENLKAKPIPLKDSAATKPMNQTANAAASPSVSLDALHQNKSSGSSPKPNSVKGIAVSSDNYTASLAKKKQGMVSNGSSHVKGKDELMESLVGCDFFDGEWVKDDSHPLYAPGSCNLVDEQFNCIGNGRPDKDYQKYKWKPKGCSLPRLDGHKMLDLLRGKRLVFVGDSLNRNMWESLICILRNAVKDKTKVYEVNGRVHFRGEASYSFIFKDYHFTVELFVSPFLVQEWEVPDKNGSKKETLRLDLVGRSSDQYKDADIIVFNTGHWWTHDKTSKGKDYYQEGSHVYDELNVLEAFRKAITTWSRWVDANINPSKSLVFFRGYSASHFSGGQWNSGGACDSETVPIDNEKYLTEYPPKMRVLEKVLKYMKTHVTYLNITRMTDFRKDGHPSIYRKQNLSPEERKSPLRYQDCSHWCLPGVPDAWNEILYAELLMRQYQNQHQQKKA